MKTVLEYFGLNNRKKTKGDLGIEIEVEGRHLPQAVDMWRREEDGSLRGAETAEYVFLKPYTVEEASVALNNLAVAYEKNGTVVDDSVRAGIHVHVNVQHLSILQLFNFITLYLILEEVLVDHCGEGRQGNLFCLRAQDADFLLRTIRRTIRNGVFREFHKDDLRYSSMNLKALCEYGSLEFRAMRGTADMGRVFKWASLLLRLREVSCQYGNPAEVIQGFSEGDTENFIQRTLGDFAEDVLKDEMACKKVRAGMRRSQDVAFACDWAKYKDIPSKLIGGLRFPIEVEFPDEPVEDF